MKIMIAAMLVLSAAFPSFAAPSTEKIENLRAEEFVLPALPPETDPPPAVPRPESEDQTGLAAVSSEVRAEPELILNNISNNQSLPVDQEIYIEGKSDLDLKKLTFRFNDEPLGDAVLKGKSFSFKYTFAKTSDFGRLELIGYNEAGVEAARAVYYINVVKAADLAGRYFNSYVLKAIDWIAANYGLKGYDINSILTHDIKYHTYGTITARKPPLTMCVAAQMEIILTAYRLYAEETGDYSVYEYLPKRSFEGLGIGDLKGHIWVNHDFHSYGTADALINFGMGERTTFDKLKPGSFVNINRTTKTGHAVAFIGYIDARGKILPEYNSSVVGFKYFSSQGKAAAGEGGFDYRYAVFSKYGCPEMPGKRDCNVIYSTGQDMLNTGTMLAPKFWKRLPPNSAFGAYGRNDDRVTVLDREYFNGVTTDD